MMQGVTPPELRATAFSMTTFIESGFAALAGLIAGSLADKIGLSEAMIWTIPVPWILCALLFSLFYITYPKDSAKLRKLMANEPRSSTRSMPWVLKTSNAGPKK